MKGILTLLMSILVLGAVMGQAEKSRYYIEGNFEPVAENGNFKYILSDIEYNKVGTTSGSRMYGQKTGDGFVQFVFDGVNTDFPGGFEDVKFWKWQNNKWQIDSETKKGTSEFESSREMSVLLNLDCSSSIGDADFEKLKRSAIEFIEHIYARSGNGNIHIGILGFNTMENTDKMVFPISPLTQFSKGKMIHFVRNLRMSHNTALYYSLKKGVGMLEQHGKSVSARKYDGSFIVTFTDGIDNNSMDAGIGSPAYGKNDPYFQYVKNHCISKTIHGKRIESHIIAVKGEDVGDNKLFESILKDLSSTLTVAKNFDQLNVLFGEIANSLVERWQNLSCYVPPRFKGRVRWTLDISDIEVENGKGKVPGDLDILLFNAHLGLNNNLYYSHVFGRVGPYIEAGFSRRSDLRYGGYVHPEGGTRNLFYDESVQGISGGISYRFGKSNFIANAGAGYYQVSGYQVYEDGGNWKNLGQYSYGNYMLQGGLTYKLKFLGLHGGTVYTQNEGMKYTVGAGFVFGGGSKKRKKSNYASDSNGVYPNKNQSSFRERSLDRLERAMDLLEKKVSISVQ